MQWMNANEVGKKVRQRGGNLSNCFDLFIGLLMWQGKKVLKD